MSNPNPEDPSAHEQTDPGIPVKPSAYTTQSLPLNELVPEALRTPPAPRVPEQAITLAMPLRDPLPETRQPEFAALLPGPSRSRLPLWLGAAAIVAGLAIWGGLSLIPDHSGRVQPDQETPEPGVPAALRPYYDRAMTGDPQSMRMLGTMYYNGLNVHANRQEGIRWFRKAAAAGSVAARKDLEQLGLAVQEP